MLGDPQFKKHAYLSLKLSFALCGLKETIEPLYMRKNVLRRFGVTFLIYLFMVLIMSFFLFFFVVITLFLLSRPMGENFFLLFSVILISIFDLFIIIFFFCHLEFVCAQ